MSRLELWMLGFTCHTYRNRWFFLWLLLSVPLVVAAALKLMDADIRPQVLR